ncbi:MAG: hypothetical protein WBO54_07815, partial [Thermoanaerobaculia bacterium]
MMKMARPGIATSLMPLIRAILLFTVLINFVSPPSIFPQQFGPFPDGTTIFVDVENTTGIEDGSEEHPFDNVQEGINLATTGDVVGVAPGLYDQSSNYVIDGLQDLSLVGMGPGRTIIRGDHSFSLIRVMFGSSALIRGFTIEEGGRAGHS